MLKTCEVCSNKFESANTTYCSRACYFESIRTAHISTCEECGKSFEVGGKSGKSKGAKYCSNVCYGLSKQKRIKRTCTVCHKEFETTPSENHKYCSRVCYGISKRDKPSPNAKKRVIYPQLEDRAWLKMRHITENKIMQEIADEIGCSISYVYAALKRFEITRSRGKFSEKQEKTMMRFYEKHGTAATCAKFNCSYSDLGNMRLRTETSLVLDYEGVDSKKGCIYIIRFDSRNDDLRRYVGRTEQQPPDQRFKQHIRDASNGSNKSLHIAIRSLDPKEQPIFEIVQDSLSKDDICAAEKNWQKKLTKEGYELLNDCKAAYGGALAGHSAIRKKSLRQKKLALFVQFYDREKHGLVPQKHMEGGEKLGLWINDQCCKYNKDQMSSEEIDEFEKHKGWVWSRLVLGFDKKLAEWIAYKVDDKSFPRIIRIWIGNLRAGAISVSSDQRAILDENGFDWNPYQSSWDFRINELRQYVEEHGDANVPQTYVTSRGTKLGGFVASCRQRNKNHRLNKKQKTELKDLGWTPKSLYRHKKTYCGKGHLYDGANTYIENDGSRRCLTCRRLRERQRKSVKRKLN